MWPSKKNLGSRLTYGLNGSPTMLPADASGDIVGKSELMYPRLHDSGPRFHEIVNSATEMSPEATKNLIKLRRVQPALSANLYDDFAAVTPLLDAMDAEAEPLHQVHAQYPAGGPLAASILLGIGAYSDAILLRGKPYYPKAKGNITPMRCHAFTSDPYTLRIVPLMPKKKNFYDQKIPESSQKTTFNIPSYPKYAAECRFPFEIHQIEACPDRKLLFVRGLRTIALLTVGWSNQPGKKGVSMKTAFTIDYTQGNILHLASSQNRFVFLDSEGSYSAYTYKLSDTWEYEKIAHGVVPSSDPSDYSAWRRLCWPPASDYFHCFSRKSIFRVHTRSAAVHKLVTFHAWSRVQDVALFGQNLFLLTSQEIIWVRITQKGGFLRLLSWKHYLDNKDKALKLAACYRESDDMYTCLIYSSRSPLAVMFSLGNRNGNPCSLRDPYILSRSFKNAHCCTLIDTTNPVESSSTLTLMVMNEAFKSTYVVYSSMSHRAFSTHQLSKTSAEIPDICPSEFTVQGLQWFFQLFNGKIHRDEVSHGSKPTESKCGIESDVKLPSVTSPDLPSDKPSFARDERLRERTTKDVEAPGESDDEKEVGVVQDYAFRLGADIGDFFYNQDPTSDSISLMANRSLATIAESVPTEVNDLEEFESMLAQLGDYYLSQGVNLQPFDSETLESSGSAFAYMGHSIQEIPKALCEFSQESVSKAAIILATSLTKSHGDFTTDYIECIEKETEGFPEQLLESLNSWTVSAPAASQPHMSRRSASEPASLGINDSIQSQSLLRRALTQNSQRASASSNLGTNVSAPHSDSSSGSDSDSESSDDSSLESASTVSPVSAQFSPAPVQSSVKASLSPPPTPFVVERDSHETSQQETLPQKATPLLRKSASQSQKNGTFKKKVVGSASQAAGQPQSQSASQILSQSMSQQASQNTSRAASQSSQSLKRPGSSFVRKKKKAKGGFA